MGVIRVCPWCQQDGEAEAEKECLECPYCSMLWTEVPLSDTESHTLWPGEKTLPRTTGIRIVGRK